MASNLEERLRSLAADFADELTVLVKRAVLERVAAALAVELTGPKQSSAGRQVAKRDDVLQPEPRPTVIRPRPPTSAEPFSLEAYERELLLRALHESGGDMKRARRLLGLPQSSLYRHVALAGIDVRAPDKPRGFANHLPLSSEAYEREALERALDAHGGHAVRAAKALGVGKSTLYRRAARLGIRAR